MKRHLVATAVCLTLAAGVVYAAKLNKEQKRLEECGVVMQEVLNIPHDLLKKAECVIRNSRSELVRTMAAGPWFAEPASISAGIGELQRCMRWRAAASGSKSAEKPPT
jgi:hypothetical protein